MSDLELLPHMYAPLQLMFAEHCIEMELKAAHRARHRHRPQSQTDFDGGTTDESIDSDTNLDITEPTTTNKQTPSPSKLPEVTLKNKTVDDTNKLETKDINNANEKELSINQQSGSSS